ncbi:MAG: DUF935 domain-containing protein [Ignavibacteriales bacterium]|jgi:Mu-like prophage protein gp29|nr:MAG: DUF935 family protein [Ignavibacteriaceae bacterium]MBW7872855.1 DUF935 family protein [Ignavibacteria bacterium]MCZ2143575.1 DUF935 domain-containing protein [Ignavibacteriales bacterium]OQY73331.1 MAG: hypothetical protein B6D45_08295 [Ignavibacteriales bacterium UTCHB3]MBV6444450.1 hypothetical protein [Ignavibacteriaceae bacterium]
MAKNLEKHIAQMSYSQIQKLLPDPDKILQRAGKGLEAYRDLMVDEHLYSVRQQRELKLQSMQWELYRSEAADAVYNLVNDCLKNLKIYELIKYILDARFMGTAIIEIIWGQKKGYWVPVQLEPKPIEWFKLKPDLSWRMYLPQNGAQNFNGEGESLPDYKFLIIQNSADPLSPYGEKILKRCFWPVTLKRGGLKFWAKYTEKYGMPQWIGKLPPGTPQESIDKLGDVLELLFDDGVAVIPADGSVEPMNPNASANSENYEKYLSHLENAISKAVLTQTLTTQLGDTGSYSATQSHANTLEDIAKADAQFVSEAIGTLIRYIVELNFSDIPDDLPKFVMFFEDEVDKVIADRDKILTEMGLKLNKAYFARTYNLQEDEFEIEPVKSASAEFAEGSPGSAFTPPAPLNDLSATLINAAVAKIQEFSSFDELLENLDKLYSALDVVKIREALAKESLAAQIKGSADANG